MLRKQSCLLFLSFDSEMPNACAVPSFFHRQGEGNKLISLNLCAQNHKAANIHQVEHGEVKIKAE